MNLRRAVVLAAGAVAVMLAGGAGAWACTSVATLGLSPAKGPVGTQITVTGAGYTVATPALAVVLRWNRADGIELARAIPDAAGKISTTFAVPAGQPGSYVVVAVQRDDKGIDRYGTPSRANFQLLPPAASPTTTAAPAPTTTAAALTVAARPVSPSSDSLPGPAVAIAVVLLLATAAGVGRQAFGR